MTENTTKLLTKTQKYVLRRKEILDTVKENPTLNADEIWIKLNRRYNKNHIKSYLDNRETIDKNLETTLETDKPKNEELPTETPTPTPETTQQLNEPTEQDLKNIKELNAFNGDKEGLLAAVSSGKIKKEHIISIIKVENWILKKNLNYEHDADTVDFMAEMLTAPISRILGQIADKNADLWIAIIAVVVVHIPVIYMALEKFLGKPKQPKQPKIEIGVSDVKK